jgi:uncharacterized RDD family membrane protein YckC
MAASRRVVTHSDVDVAEGSLAIEPEWRREVSSKLRAYRVRRHGASTSELQSELPYESILIPTADEPGQSAESSVPSTAARAPAYRKRRPERFEISIPKQEVSRAAVAQSAFAGAADALFPVASLPERRRAALLDAALLLFSYGGMLALFCALGGHIAFNKLDIVVAAATLALFYAQYFTLFTVFGGSTPGMMLRGVRVVTYDGSIPTSRQMVWRSFGYLISAGTCFMGFAWALWDEDHLCWHDRISLTYLTPIDGITADDHSATTHCRPELSR